MTLADHIYIIEMLGGADAIVLFLAVFFLAHSVAKLNRKVEDPERRL